MHTIPILIIRVAASPLVNLFQKRLNNEGLSPSGIVMISYLFFALLSLPLFLYLRPFEFPREFWWSVLILGILDMLGNWFLVRSLSMIDLSVFGPLNAYKPVFALLIAVVLVGEVPAVAGWVGVLVIVAGSTLLGMTEGRGMHWKWRFFSISRGTAYRLLGILLTALAAVFSKKAIILSSPLITLMYWSVIGMPLAFIFWVRSRPPAHIAAILSRNKLNIAGLLIFFLLLQLSTLLVFQNMLVGYSLALFQLSAIISVFFGHRFFGERNAMRRLAAALVMVLGAVILLIFG